MFFQVKFRSDRTSATYDELTNAFFQSQNCSGMYVFSNSTHVPDEFRENEAVFPILINDLINLPKDFLTGFTTFLKRLNTIVKGFSQSHINQELLIK